jgi:polyketide synthase Type III
MTRVHERHSSASSTVLATDPRAGLSARIASVSTSVSADAYSQEEVLDAFGVEDPRIRSLFLNSAIERRHLTLPPMDEEGGRPVESQGQLLRKHLTRGLEMGSDAVRTCLERIPADVADVRYLCCVSSTGFITPGFSARLIDAVGIPRSCSRIDVVGMGCNAGLNGLAAVASWAATHPGELAVMACIEVCSAAYVFDGTMRTSVVNSLFGDGAAAIALVGAEDDDLSGPAIVRFEGELITEAIEAMRYDWDDRHERFSFFLDPQIPYVVGANIERVVERLLEGTGLLRSDIAHWVIHSGGKKVIDSVQVNLGLSRHDTRHTRSVLRDYGNVSSASFLFSYARLLDEGVVEPGDYAVLIAMGPGSTIETALVHWPEQDEPA